MIPIKKCQFFAYRRANRPLNITNALLGIFNIQSLKTLDTSFFNIHCIHLYCIITTFLFPGRTSLWNVRYDNASLKQQVNPYLGGDYYKSISRTDCKYLAMLRIRKIFITQSFFFFCWEEIVYKSGFR